MIATSIELRPYLGARSENAIIHTAVLNASPLRCRGRSDLSEIEGQEFDHGAPLNDNQTCAVALDQGSRSL
jgi:hypothetical protein